MLVEIKSETGKVLSCVHVAIRNGKRFYQIFIILFEAINSRAISMNFVINSKEDISIRSLKDLSQKPFLVNGKISCRESGSHIILSL